MARVLWAWELGARSGHLRSFAAIGRALAARGHSVDYAVRDLAEAVDVLTPEERYYQAPILQVPSGGLPPAENHADLLLRVGYRNVRPVIGVVRGWLRLFDLLRPNLIVLDRAPSVLLAARIAGIDRVDIGLGFFWPPATTPMPSLQPWKPSSEAARLEREQQVVAVINQVLREFRAPEINTLAALYQGTESIHGTFPELDHYGPRKGARYWGALIDTPAGRPPPWPAGAGEAAVHVLPRGLPGVSALGRCPRVPGPAGGGGGRGTRQGNRARTQPRPGSGTDRPSGLERRSHRLPAGHQSWRTRHPRGDAAEGGGPLHRAAGSGAGGSRLPCHQRRIGGDGPRHPVGRRLCHRHASRAGLGQAPPRRQGLRQAPPRPRSRVASRRPIADHIEARFARG